MLESLRTTGVLGTTTGEFGPEEFATLDLKTALPPKQRKLNGGRTRLEFGRIKKSLLVNNGTLSFSLVISKMLLIIPPDLAQATKEFNI